MPYLDPEQANNRRADCISAMQRRNGPPPWREPVLASPAVRSVVIAWPAGYRAVPHYHSRADESFYIVSGMAEFRFDRGTWVRAPPGTCMFAPRGTLHEIRVGGGEAMLMWVTVAPNEPDDTVEVPK
jgi:mannose-6-phosphate isomerase-like protein (cupin superfamily)